MSSPASARATVHMFVSRIRKAAGAETVVSDASSYRVAFDLDVDRFFATMLEAERRRGDDPTGAAVVDAALAASNAGVFDEFADDPWLQPVIASFAEQRRTGEQLWSALRVEAGTATEVIDRLDAAAVRDPSGDPMEHLMVALVPSRAAERCARRVRPGPSTPTGFHGAGAGPGLRWAHRAVLDHMVPPESVSDPPRIGTARGDAFVGRARRSRCWGDCSIAAGS